MARVTVRMFATVREAAGTASIQLDARDMDDLLEKLGKSLGPRLSRLLSEYDSDPDRLVVLLNGRNIPRSLSKPVNLTDGDEVAVFPPVSGG